MPKSKSANSWISSKILRSTKPSVPKFRKEHYSQDLPVQEKLCWPKRVLGKPKYPSSQSVVLNSSSFMRVWVPPESEIFSKTLKNKPQRLSSSMKLMLSAERDKTSSEEQMIKEPTLWISCWFKWTALELQMTSLYWQPQTGRKCLITPSQDQAGLIELLKSTFLTSKGEEKSYKFTLKNSNFQRTKPSKSIQRESRH